MFQAYKPYIRQIIKLSLPIVIGQIGIVLMGVADVVMIGKIDAANLAAAGLANAVYFLITILGIGTLTAISPLVAKAKGAGHSNETALLFRQGIWAAILLSAFIGAVVWILTANLDWFKQAADVTALTTSYLHILNAGTIFMLLFISAKQFSDGLSITKPSAIITIAGLLFNILWNWILIYGKLGFPALGLDGAGIATTLTRILMAACMLLYVFKNPLYKAWLHVKDKKYGPQLLKEIFVIGLPSGMQYFFEVGAFAGAAIMIGWFGKEQLAAHQIAINIASVTYMVATGFSAAGSILVGDAWGRKNKTDLIKAGRSALLLGFAFMAVMACTLAIGKDWIVACYTDDEVVSQMAIKLLLIAALFQLSDGVQCVSLGILRGISDTKISTIVTIIAYWVIGIPGGWLLAQAFNLSLYGIWFGLSAGLTFSAIMLSIRFIKESKRFDAVTENKERYQELIQQT